MAKSSKAKKKSAKKTYKKTAKKTYKKAKKKTTRKITLKDDPCDQEETAVFQTQQDVDDIQAKLERGGLSPEQRAELERELHSKQTALGAAVRALARCRRLHPGHPH
jgi:hypothetical protein